MKADTCTAIRCLHYWDRRTILTCSIKRVMRSCSLRKSAITSVMTSVNNIENIPGMKSLTESVFRRAGN